MSDYTFVENIGKIVKRKDEDFWILPKIYVANENQYFVISSPVFSYLGENWKIVMSTNWNRQTSNKIVYLWRQFRCDLPGCEYLVEIAIGTFRNSASDYYYKKGLLKCDYGFQAIFGSSVVQNTAQCGLVKVCFRIKSNSDAVPPSIGTSEEKNNEKDTSKQNETDNECEITSDEKNSDLCEDKGIKILSENLKQLLIDERMTDAVLKVDTREFKVHKNILVARSAVFASIFEHDMTEKNDNVVDIPDCAAESFEVFLHYVYCGGVETLSESNVYNVYYAADKYRVDDLKEKCVKFMIDNMSVETFCDVIALSLRHGESKLQKVATDFFCKNMKIIIKTVQWQTYLGENSTQANELLIKAVNA